MTNGNNEAVSTFEDLIAVQNIRGPVTLGVGSIPSDASEINYRSFNIGDSLAEEFRSLIQKVIDSKRYDYHNHDLRLLSYDAGYKPEPTDIEWIRYLDSPWLSSLLRQLPNPANIDLYDESEREFVKDLRFYILFAKTPQNENVYCFSFYRKLKELAKSNNIFVSWVGDRFELLRDCGFMFDARIDCILFRNHLYSFRKTNFHGMFRFYDQVRTVANESLARIHQTIPIANFDMFHDACMNHSNKMAKLVNIAGKPYISQITMGDVQMIIERNHLP